MLINKLIKVISDGRLKLIKNLIEINKPLTRGKIRKFDKRNPYNLNKDLNILIKKGILTKEILPVKIGKNKAIIYFPHYSINKKNKIVKILKNDRRN